MVISKSPFIALVFSLLLSFGLLCSGVSAHGRKQYESDPQRKYEECQERCDQKQQGQREQQQCQRKCWEQYKEQERGEHENYHHLKQSRSEEEEEGQQRNNPYYFPKRRSFQTRFRDEEGNFKILQRFAENSSPLKGINDYRFAIFEANPNTFVLPHHSDAEAIYFVTKGKGTITFVTHENKESYNVQRGTAVSVPAACTVYVVNQDKQEKLTIAVLALPVNTPGKYEVFFPAGNNKPESYYRAFSYEVLEAVFNTQREKLEKIFEEQRGQEGQQGMFRRAKPEQIRALSQQATSPGQRGGESLAVNLFSQSPVYSNRNGRFFEVCPEAFSQFQNMDVAVAAIKLNPGAIFVPHYNSKTTFLVLITDGYGYVEMACPHLSRQSQGSQSGRQDRREQEEEESEDETIGEYEQVKTPLSPGDIFVVPAGHAVTFFASKDQPLNAVAFGLNAQNNQRIFLAGKKNMVRQMDSEAKELSFGVPSKLVDDIFNNPDESYFMSFSQQRQRGDERRGNPLASIMDFARLF
ncbi:vicilin [Herrania umbratica]|uniref:Vicilin n=2 Tax=Herrania TaxID=108869 RepID=A0A6J1AXD8_9ROSI|nr:vicilin [Herrania umbratica]